MREFFSLKGVFRTRNVAIMAMLAGLTAILAQFSVFVSPTFRAISFTFLPNSLVAILFGPWAGVAFGFVSDTVAYLYKPGGPYFPGYAVTEMVGNFIYACFLYKRPVSIPRVLLARVLVVITCVFGLNFLWQSILFGAAASVYYTSVRVISNLLQLPVYVLLIVLFGRLAREMERRVGAAG